MRLTAACRGGSPKNKGMVGVDRVVLAKRERPIILRPLGKGLEGITLRYLYAIRGEDSYFEDIPDVKLVPDMVKLAGDIIDTKAGSFDPTEFVDHYETAVVEMLKKKQAGVPVSKEAPPANHAMSSTSWMRCVKVRRAAAVESYRKQPGALLPRRHRQNALPRAAERRADMKDQLLTVVDALLQAKAELSAHMERREERTAYNQSSRSNPLRP
jgi:DNA end-binding protein Ku